MQRPNGKQHSRVLRSKPTSMKIILVGPGGSGKTTLLQKIIRQNEFFFGFILDGVETLGASVGDVLGRVPQNTNVIITAFSLDSVPQFFRQNALVLNVPQIRNQ
jgi:ABC-type cobalamin/Fe3+-siderophores transport system ATPase subunit